MKLPNTDYETQCQYIGSEDYNVYTPVCCKPSVKGRSYCLEHVHLVYQKGSAVHRRKDTRQAHALADIINDINEVYEELLLEGVIGDLDEA